MLGVYETMVFSFPALLRHVWKSVPLGSLLALLNRPWGRNWSDFCGDEDDNTATAPALLPLPKHHIGLLRSVRLDITVKWLPGVLLAVDLG